MNFSIEFFPPRQPEGLDKLLTVADEINSEFATHKPEYFSVTYGAGGSTQAGTVLTINKLIQKGYTVAPHLSCIGADKGVLKELLLQYQKWGIRRIVALRGDLPSGSRQIGDLRFAIELVSFIRAEFGDYFEIEVAAYPEKHPEAKNFEADIGNLVAKLKAGANRAITQYFFNADAFFYLQDALSRYGVDAPLIPGIMPITNSSQLIRFSQMCGAEIPRWILQRLVDMEDDRVGIAAFGEEVVAKLCQQLRAAGVDTLHFYSLNQSGPTLKLLHKLFN